VAADPALGRSRGAQGRHGRRKITLKHGEIPTLEMPPMTMVFQVKDPALLPPLKAGDLVRFRADKINGAYTVLRHRTLR
jgi:Cu/Ag efflux protein CusF